MFSDEGWILLAFLQEVHTLTNAEVMPARQVTNIAVQPGDLFQDANERSTVGHCIKYMEICLPFKVSHEKTQDIAEVDNHEHKHGDGGHKGQSRSRFFVGKEDNFIKEIGVEEDIEERIGANLGQQSEADKKEEIKLEVVFLHMAYFVGHDRLDFFRGHGIKHGRGDQQIAKSLDEPHNACRQHSPLKQRPAHDLGILKALFPAEIFYPGSDIASRQWGAIPESDNNSRKGQDKNQNEEDKN